MKTVIVLPIQITLFLLFVGCLSLFINSNNINAHNLQQIGIESIVERGHFYLEGSKVPNLHASCYPGSDTIPYKEHVYSSRQYGQYLIGSIAYFFLSKLGITYTNDYIYASGMVTLFTSVLMTAIVVVLLFNISLFFTNNIFYSFLISVFMCFGTMVFPYSTITHYDIYAMFFLFISFYYLFRKYRMSGDDKPLSVFVSGACSGLSFFMSIKALPIILMMFVYIFCFKNKKDICIFIMAVFLGVLPTFLFNSFEFGNPFFFPETIGTTIFKDAAPKYFSLSNIISRFYIYFLSPSISIAFFSPIYIVSLFGFFLIPKKYFIEKVVLPFTLFATFLQLTTVQTTGCCQYGPRYLLMTVPFIFIGLSGFFIQRQSFIENLISKNIPVHKIIYCIGIISIIIFIPGGIVGAGYCDTSKHAFFSHISTIMMGQIPDFRFTAHGFTFILLAGLLFFIQNQEVWLLVKEKIKSFDQRYGIQWFYLSVIMIIAILARTYNLNGLPLGLYVDEASVGYNAFSIAEIGRDEHGNVFPLFFKAFGEYKNPVFIYFAAILIKLFGPSIYILRLTSSILGILTVFYTYKLSNVYFDKRVSLLAAFLLAISPWHLLFSRQAWDPSSLSLFLVLGLYLISKGLKNNDNRYILYSVIPIGISFYCYAIAKAFVPLLYLFFIMLNLKNVFKKKSIFISWLLLLLFLLSPLIYASNVNHEINGRFNMLSIVNAPEEIRNELKKTPFSFLTKTKLTLVPAIFVQNYFKHMSFKFLLTKGDGNLRHNPTGKGQLLFFTFWMGFIGLIYLLFKGEKLLYIFPVWFFLFPIPASLTWESLPHGGRTICGLPVFEILAAVGFYFSISAIKKAFSKPNKLLAILLTIILSMFFVKSIFDLNYSIKNFYQDYAKNSMIWYDYEVCAISKATQDISKSNIILSPFEINPISILFLQKIDPFEYFNKKISINYNKENDLKTFAKHTVRIGPLGKYKEGDKLSYIYNELTGEPMFELNIPPEPKLIINKNYKPKRIGGLNANYFQGANFDKFKFNKVDSKIDFDYIWGSPDKTINGDDFSIEWTGWIHVETSGVYKFITKNDNGIKLTIDDNLIINDWNESRPKVNIAEINLSAGWHPIVLDYNEVDGTALIKLEWQKPNGKREVIPSNVFSPDLIFKQ